MSLPPNCTLIATLGTEPQVVTGRTGPAAGAEWSGAAGGGGPYRREDAGLPGGVAGQHHSPNEI